MSLWYEMTLPIDSRDVDGKGVCKASALLGHLQEAATQAAEHGGFSREVITREHGAFWMLTRVWYRLERPLRWEEELTIRTWHRGGRAATLYRDYDLYVGREPVGECVSVDIGLLSSVLGVPADRTRPAGFSSLYSHFSRLNSPEARIFPLRRTPAPGGA